MNDILEESNLYTLNVLRSKRGDQYYVRRIFDNHIEIIDPEITSILMTCGEKFNTTCESIFVICE